MKNETIIVPQKMRQ